jgi:hypothetical protein
MAFGRVNLPMAPRTADIAMAFKAAKTIPTSSILTNGQSLAPSDLET